MKYLNKRTGTTIDVKSKIISNNWQAVKPANIVTDSDKKEEVTERKVAKKK